MPEVIARLRQEGRDLSLVLTDLYPNVAAVTRFEHGAVPGVAYRAQALDATACAAMPADLYTMVNGFHHMTPDKAGAILRSVVERYPHSHCGSGRQSLALLGLARVFTVGSLREYGHGIAVYTADSPRIGVALFFTYCVPIIPFFFAWDGQASYPGFTALMTSIVWYPNLKRMRSWEKGICQTAQWEGYGHLFIWMSQGPVRGGMRVG